MGTMQELKGTAVERAMRVDLAAAFRLAVRLDLHEGVCNHFSVMLPDGKRFLLNRYGLHWSEVTAGNLLALDAAGNVLAGRGRVREDRLLHPRAHPRRQPARDLRPPYPYAVCDGVDPARGRPPGDGRAERAALPRRHRLRRHLQRPGGRHRRGRPPGARHGQQARDVPRQPRRDRGRAFGRRGFRPHVLPGARVPPAGAGALDGRKVSPGTA